MALLAAYQNKSSDMTLEQYLETAVFQDAESVTVAPTPEEVAGFAKYLEAYRKGLSLVHCAVENI
jgi:hypothetical protein